MGEVICISCRQSERFCVCVRPPFERLIELTRLLEIEIDKDIKKNELKDEQA